MARLRAPGGCPWDREQNFDTIKPYLLEETYEVLGRHRPARLARAGRRAGRPDAAGRFLRADGVRRRQVSHRRFARRDVREADPPASARFRGRQREDRRRREAPLGRDQGRREERARAMPQKGRLESVPRNLPALVEAQQISFESGRGGVRLGKSRAGARKTGRRAARAGRRARERRRRQRSKARSAICFSCW